MGTGPSKLTDAATAEQKDKIGVFVLGRKETYAIDALSTILTKMLEANRLFDIHKLLTADEGCKSLFMVIQSAIESEFLRLKFPDPKVSSAITGITTVPTDYYSASLAPRTGRKKLCDELAHFLVRLITLIAALASSIKSNGNLKNLMSPPPLEEKEEAINELKMTDPLLKIEKVAETAKIPEFLQKDSFLVKKRGGNLYLFKNSSFAIQTDRMLLYDSSKNITPVFTIQFDNGSTQLPSFQPVAPISPTTAATQPAAIPPPLSQPAAAAVAAPPPQPFAGTKSVASTNYTNASSMGGGPLGTTLRRATRKRTSRRRAAITRRRRQHGGGELDPKKSLFRVNISFIGTGKTVNFFTNALGDTYELNVASYSVTSRDPVPTPVPIMNRIASLFQEAERASLATFSTERKEIGKDAEKEVFAGLQSREKSLALRTIEKLKNDFKTLNETGTGTAPAPYRAFLLASEPVGGSGILHMLCSDEWRNQWVTSVMTYSLFQTLFNDTIDGKMSARNAEECRKMMKAFSQSGAMKESAQSGEVATSFANLRFTDLSDVYKASICAQTKSVSPTREESIPGDVAILRKAHNDIRLAYEAYIDKLIPFTMSIVKVVRALKDGVQQELTFRLDPAFFTTEGTSLAFLERKIAEARVLMGSHLLTVESIYADAVKALELSKKGISSA